MVRDFDDFVISVRNNLEYAERRKGILLELKRNVLNNHENEAQIMFAMFNAADDMAELKLRMYHE